MSYVVMLLYYHILSEKESIFFRIYIMRFYVGIGFQFLFRIVYYDFFPYTCLSFLSIVLIFQKESVIISIMNYE